MAPPGVLGGLAYRRKPWLFGAFAFCVLATMVVVSSTALASHSVSVDGEDWTNYLAKGEGGKWVVNVNTGGCDKIQVKWWTTEGEDAEDSFWRETHTYEDTCSITDSFEWTFEKEGGDHYAKAHVFAWEGDCSVESCHWDDQSLKMGTFVGPAANPVEGDFDLGVGESGDWTVEGEHDDCWMDHVGWYVDGDRKTRNHFDSDCTPRDTFSWDFDNEGPHTIRAKVWADTPSGWKSDSTSWSVDVKEENTAPTVDSKTPSDDTPSVKKGDSITFGVDVSDPDGDLDRVEWEVGGSTQESDGVSGSSGSASFSHTFDSSGSTTVTATVYDGEGASDSTQWDVTVEENEPPTARFDCDRDGLEVWCDGSASSDSDGSISSYQWAWGDGDTSTGGADPHTYDQGGEYTVTLTVTDDDGASDQESKTVAVGQVGKVKSISKTQTPSYTGEKVNVEVTVENVGTSSGEFYLVPYLPGLKSDLLGSGGFILEASGSYGIERVELGPGERQDLSLKDGELQFPVRAPSGEYKVKIGITDTRCTSIQWCSFQDEASTSPFQVDTIAEKFKPVFVYADGDEVPFREDLRPAPIEDYVLEEFEFVEAGGREGDGRPIDDTDDWKQLRNAEERAFLDDPMVDVLGQFDAVNPATKYWEWFAERDMDGFNCRIMEETALNLGGKIRRCWNEDQSLAREGHFKDEVGTDGKVYYKVQRVGLGGSGIEYVLQYWQFYPVNLNYRVNQHEGDWEKTFVFLDGNLDPISVGGSSHYGQDPRLPWTSDSVTITDIPSDGSGEETHPKVFVARGAHANYVVDPTGPRNVDFQVFRLGKSQTFCGDIVPDWKKPGSEERVSSTTYNSYELEKFGTFPGSTIDPTTEEETFLSIDLSLQGWAQFPGDWGEPNSGWGFSGSGPTPPHQNEWSNPVGEFPDESVIGCLRSNSTVIFEDEQGRRLGLYPNNLTPIEEIPGGSIGRIAKSNGTGPENARYSLPPGNYSVTIHGRDEGSFNLGLASTDGHNWTSITYEGTITENGTGEANLTENLTYEPMEVNKTGDNSTDEIIQPERMEVQGDLSASFDWTPKEPKTDVQVQFQGNASNLSAITSWTWRFPDGTTKTGRNVTRTFADGGPKPVTLEVATAGNESASATNPVHVQNRPPTAAILASPDPPVARIPADLFAHVDDPDGHVVSGGWDIEDGPTSTDLALTYVFPERGTYNVTLRVTDDDGATTTVTRTFEITETAPAADFGFIPREPTVEQSVAFRDESEDPDGNIYVWDWDLGDGTHSEVRNPYHRFPDDKTYEVTLQVKDGDRYLSMPVTKTVDVHNLPPSAGLTVEDANITTAETLRVRENASDPDDGPGLTGALFYDWAFGDGATANGSRATHSFADDGTYEVEIAVTDDDGATDTATRTVEVANVGPEASFTTSPSEPAALQDVQFQDTSTDSDGQIVAWEWGFGDGGTATGASPTHEFPDDGTYNVTLTVTDDDGATATATQPLKITNAAPSVEIVEAPDDGKTTDTLAFEADASDPDGSIENMRWDFGDGNSAPGPRVNHSYDDDGTYTVIVAVTDDDGTTMTASHEVKVHNVAPSLEDCTASPASPSTQDEIAFSCEASDPDGHIGSSSRAPTFSDGFEDGDFDGWAPIHVDTRGCVYRDPSRDEPWQVTKYAPLDGEFALEHPSLCSSTSTEDILATDERVLDPSRPFEVSFQFYFEDGEHRGAQTYLVNASGTGEGGSGVDPNQVVSFFRLHNPTGSKPDKDQAVEIFDHRITISDRNDAPIIDDEVHTGSLVREDGRFVASLDGQKIASLSVSEVADELDLGQVFRFAFSGSGNWGSKSTIWYDDLRIQSGTSSSGWSWSLGDGNTSAEPSPTHFYADNGTYTVEVTVIDDDGATNKSSLEVAVRNVPARARFDHTPETPFTNETVTLSDESLDPDGTIADRSWTLQGPAEPVIVNRSADNATLEVEFPDDGNYTLSLNVTDDDGAGNETSSIIEVQNRDPVPGAEASQSEPKTQETVRFSSNATDADGQVVEHRWDFDDGTTATGADVNHSYADDGNYTVTLTVVDDDGASSTASLEVAVQNRAPSPAAEHHPEQPLTKSPVLFWSNSTDLDGDVVGHRWDFGDGSSATGAHVTHEYADDGNYTVTLTVVDDDGAEAETTLEVEVRNRPPEADFTWSPTEPVVDESATFGAEATDPDGEVDAYDWDFGDGNPSSGSPADHTYTENGTYQVTLTVTDNDDATDTATRTIHVVGEPTEPWNVTASGETTSDTIEVSWNVPNATGSQVTDFQNYTLHWYPAGDEGNVSTIDVEHPNTTVQHEDRESGQEYCYYVTAWNEHGLEGPASDGGDPPDRACDTAGLSLESETAGPTTTGLG